MKRTSRWVFEELVCIKSNEVIKNKILVRISDNGINARNIIEKNPSIVDFIKAVVEFDRFRMTSFEESSIKVKYDICFFRIAPKLKWVRKYRKSASL